MSSETEMAARRAAAVAFAEAQSATGGPVWDHLCQKFVRIALGVGPGYSSAIIAWSHVPKADRHGGHHPPPGVPVYWAIGTFGHAALSAGGGAVWSTDIRRRGHVDKVGIREITDRWNARYLGWAEVINGVRVIQAPPGG